MTKTAPGHLSETLKQRSLIVAAPAQASNSSTNAHIQGNVDLAIGVAVAPGVLLGAAPGCRLVISTGVCLAADVVVQARHGDLVLEPGVSLGSGVLVVGHGVIGQHTCVGANSTIINPALGASQVVAPGSLLGDPSQIPSQAPSQGQASTAQNPPPSKASSYANGSSAHGSYGVGNSFQNSSAQNGSTPNGASVSGSFGGSSGSGSGKSSGQGKPVYGKAQVNRLLITLFPQRQALNGASPEDRP